MFSLQHLFGRADLFFDLLEASAEEARTSVQALIQFTQAPDVTSLDQFIAARRKDKRITQQISDALCRTFVTALEREDIEALSKALYKIPKTVEKVGERMILAPAVVREVDFSRQLNLLDEATATVLNMVKELRGGMKLEEVSTQNDRLQHVEGEADKLILELLKDLYQNTHDPLRVIILKDLYELIERVIDRCRDAGNVVTQIVMKHA